MAAATTLRAAASISALGGAGSPGGWLIAGQSSERWGEAAGSASARSSAATGSARIAGPWPGTIRRTVPSASRRRTVARLRRCAGRSPSGPRTSVGRSVSASPLRTVARQRDRGEAAVADTDGRTVRDLGHRPGQRGGATATGQDRNVPAGPQLLRSRCVTGVDVGQGDRGDPPAAPGDLRLDRVEERLAGIARIDDRHLGPPDEHGVRRPAGRSDRVLAAEDAEAWPDALERDRPLRRPDQVVADLGEAGHPLEPLEGGRRRRPHLDLAAVHPGKGGPWRQPGVPGHLAGVDVEHGVARQLGREEARVEPAREGARGRPAGDLDEVVRAQLEPLGRDEVGERRAAAARVGRRAREQHPDLLPRLADRGDPMGHEERRIVRGSASLPDEPRAGVTGFDPATREDVQPGREGHRVGPQGEQDLEPVGPRADEHDRRRRTRLDRRGRARGGSLD